MSKLEAAGPPESCPALAVQLCLTIAQLGADPALLKQVFANGAAVAEHIATMDLTVIRLRGRDQDDKVRADFASAALWLGAFPERYERLGGF